MASTLSLTVSQPHAADTTAHEDQRSRYSVSGQMSSQNLSSFYQAASRDPSPAQNPPARSLTRSRSNSVMEFHQDNVRSARWISSINGSFLLQDNAEKDAEIRTQKKHAGGRKSRFGPPKSGDDGAPSERTASPSPAMENPPYPLARPPSQGGADATRLTSTDESLSRHASSTFWTAHPDASKDSRARPPSINTTPSYHENGPRSASLDNATRNGTIRSGESGETTPRLPHGLPSKPPGPPVPFSTKEIFVKDGDAPHPRDNSYERAPSPLPDQNTRRGGPIKIRRPSAPTPDVVMQDETAARESGPSRPGPSRTGSSLLDRLSMDGPRNSETTTSLRERIVPVKRGHDEYMRDGPGSPENSYAGNGVATGGDDSPNKRRKRSGRGRRGGRRGQ